METNISRNKNGIYDFGDLFEFLHAVKNDKSLQDWQDEQGVINLMNDINLQGRKIPIESSFKCTFDGNNHTISGLRIVEEVGTSHNIFGDLKKDGIIRNLRIIGSISTTSSYSGIIGINNGLILNCSFKGDCETQESLGGIVEYNDESGMIIGCTYEGNILGGERDCGGITGSNRGIISRCHVNATIQNDGYTGLIAGTNSGKISRCTCTGSVSCKSGPYGGLVGSNSGEIADCDCTCNFPKNPTSDAGGITGCNTGRISGCTFAGETQTQRFGGIVEHNEGEIISCTCKRLIAKSSGEDICIGGIVSRNDTNGSIFSCHSEALTSSGKYPVGRIAYNNSGKLLGCTWKGSANEKGIIEGEDTTIRVM